MEMETKHNQILDINIYILFLLIEVKKSFSVFVSLKRKVNQMNRRGRVGRKVSLLYFLVSSNLDQFFNLKH